MTLKEFIESLKKTKIELQKYQKMAGEKNTIVDPNETVKMMHFNRAYDAKVSFIENFVKRKIKTPDDYKKIFDGIKDETKKKEIIDNFEKYNDSYIVKALNTYKQENKNKGIKTKYDDLSFSEAYSEFDKDAKTDEEIAKYIDETIKLNYRITIKEYLIEDASNYELFYSDLISGENEKEFSDEASKINFEEVNLERIKDKETEIKKYESFIKTEEDKEILDYLNNEVFSEMNEKSTDYYSKLAEKYGVRCEMNTREEAMEYIESNNIYKDKLSRSNKETSFNANFELNDFERSGIISKIEKETFKFSDNNKKIILEIFDCLEKMERYGSTKENPLPLLNLNDYSPEESEKLYAFLNIKNINVQLSEELDKEPSEESFKKIKDMALYHKNMIKEYKHMLDLANQIDTDYIPSNVSISRTSFMPTEFIQDYKGTSRINTLWHALALIKRCGFYKADFLSNPIKVYEESVKNITSGKFIDESFSDFSKEDFILNMSTYSEEVEKRFKRATSKTDGSRNVGALNMFDKENIKKNSAIGGLFSEYIHGNIPTFVMDSNYKFLNKDFGIDNKFNIQTYKNILIFQKEPVEYSKLSANPEFPKNPLTNDVINNFDYDKYLNENEINIEKLSTTITNLKDKVENNDYYLDAKEPIDKAVQSLCQDIIKTKNIYNEKGYEKIFSESGLEYSDVMDAKRDKERSHTFSRNELNKYKAQEETSKDLGSLLAAYKGMNENYNKRSGFFKAFSVFSYMERSVMKDMRKEILKNVNENELDKFLKNESTLSGVRESTPANKEITKTQESNVPKKRIEVEACNDKNKIVTKNNTNKEQDLKKVTEVSNNKTIGGK